MIICCDIDGVLNDFVPKLLKHYNTLSNKNIQLQDITTYHFTECLPKEDADGIARLFTDQDFLNSLQPLVGAQSVLKKLIKQGHCVIIATATEECNFAQKCQWMKAYFPFISADNIIRIVDKSLLKVDVLIDDNMDNLIGSFSERICLDYPYNRSTSKDYAYNIKRADNWDDVIEIINTIEKEMKEWERM